MKAAVVYKTDGLLKRVVEVLREMDVQATPTSEPTSELEEYDFIVSIGGDGTILRVLQKIKRCPPIFGINTGRIGLLAHSTPENFEAKLKKAVRDFEVETFPRLACSVEANEMLALNEFAILSRQPGKMMNVEIYLDGAEIDRLRCDGVIVATQIGSTGYAFSAGGPVVDPYLDSVTIVPIAPFRFGWKPFVVGMSRKIEISAEEAILIADGQNSVSISGRIRICRSEHPAVFFRKEERVSELFRKIRAIE